jgi:hypothetical protein
MPNTEQRAERNMTNLRDHIVFHIRYAMRIGKMLLSIRLFHIAYLNVGTLFMKHPVTEQAGLRDG